MFGLPKVCIQGAHATDQDRHLGNGQGQQARPIHQQLSRGFLASLPNVVAESVCGRLQYGKGMHICLLLRRIRAAWREWDLHILAGLLCGFLDGCAAAQNNQVSKRDLLPTGLRAIEILLDRFQRLKDLSQFGRLVNLPILLRREANARTVSSATLVAAAERSSRRPGRRDQLGDGESGCKDPDLQGRNILFPDQFMIHCGSGVLPY